MPPQPSQPIRDGGSAINSSSLVSEPYYYSNEDIKLLYDIVARGEEILPQLPPRDRLPTEALFQASEDVLPQHGFDLDDPPAYISRLIFKIGGLRGGQTLRDKFESVLGGMGIQVQYISSNPQSRSSRYGGTETASVLSYNRTEDPTGNPHVFLQRRPRRRHSRVSEDTGHVASIANRQVVGQAGVRSRSQSFESTGSDTTGDNKLGADLIRVRPKSMFANIHRHTHESTNLRADLARLSVRDVPEPSFFIRNSENRHSLRHTRGLPSDDPESDALPGAGDTTAQNLKNEELDDYSDDVFPKEDGPENEPIEDDDNLQRPMFLARLSNWKKRDAEFDLQLALKQWNTATKESQGLNGAREAQAAAFDGEDVLGDVLFVWDEVHRRNAKKGRRASKTGDLYTMFLTVDYWQRQTQEEVERTQVARRHLLRKRTFDGWHGQTVDNETKIENFGLSSAFSLWSLKTTHHEVQGKMAAKCDEEELVGNALQTWQDKHRDNLADEFDRYHTAADSLDLWSNASRRGQQIQEVAEVVDEQETVNDAMCTWYDRTADASQMAYDAATRSCVNDMQDVMSTWHKQATLSKLLRDFLKRDEWRLQSDTTNLWQLAAQEAARNNEAADVVFLHGQSTEWNLDTKLKVFQEYVEEETMEETVHYWMLEERLALFKRYAAERDTTMELEKWSDAAKDARALRCREAAYADMVYCYYSRFEFLYGWQEALEKRQKDNVRMEYKSDLVRLYRKGQHCLEHWQGLAQETAYDEAEYNWAAERFDRRWMVSNVLNHWPRTARKAYEEKITRLYHDYRQSYKTNLATDCLETWRAATAESLGAKEQAKHYDFERMQVDMDDLVDYWNSAAQTSQFIGDVAEQAKEEYHMAKWQERAGDACEFQMDAADFDEEKTLKQAMSNWEFVAMELESKKPAIQALQEKNDRRIYHSILSDWRQKVLPEPEHLRASAISRRSTRPRRFATPGPLRQQPETPAFRSTTSHQPPSNNRLSYQPGGSSLMPRSSIPGPPSTTSHLLLASMIQFDEDDSFQPNDSTGFGFMSTPSRPRNEQRERQMLSGRERGRSSISWRNMPSTTPSAILPSPYERQLRQGYHHGQSQDQGQSRVSDIWEVDDEDEDEV